jgi:hypothetical protein
MAAESARRYEIEILGIAYGPTGFPAVSAISRCSSGAVTLILQHKLPIREASKKSVSLLILDLPS